MKTLVQSTKDAYLEILLCREDSDFVDLIPGGQAGKTWPSMTVCYINGRQVRAELDGIFSWLNNQTQVLLTNSYQL